MDADIYKMIYNKNNSRIFGKYFVKNNKNKGKLIINNKKFQIKEYININEIKKDEFKVKIFLTRNISNKCYFFGDCISLLKFALCDDEKNYPNKIIFKEKIEEESLFDYYVIEEKNNIFYNEIADFPLNNFSEIQTHERITDKNTMKFFFNNLNYSNILNKFYLLEGIFYNCKSLNSLSNIFKCDNDNNHIIINMGSMFYNCSSLLSLPDISKWNTNKVFDMSLMFYNCSSLLSLPDISKWDTKNIIDISAMFYNCRSLSSLPDISKWNINNGVNIRSIFANCSSLLSFPDVSNWNINNANNICLLPYTFRIYSIKKFKNKISHEFNLDITLSPNSVIYELISIGIIYFALLMYYDVMKMFLYFIKI